jgi:peptidoglycan/xylan/chitin deacetylase (PgdA/CDA1 family)
MTVSHPIPILMYHSVASDPSPQFAQFAVSPSEFAEHVRYLAEQGYSSLTVSDLVARLAASAPLPRRPIVLTFDDGFADFHTAALPVLVEWHFTATLYLVTGHIGGTSEWLWREGAADQPMLTWEQIGEIAAEGIECGAHTHQHEALDLLPPDRQRDEVQRSKAILEERLSIPVPSFAYPYGFQTARTRRIVREAGFLSACAVRYRLCTPRDDPYMLARLKIARGTSITQLARQLDGRQSPIMLALYAGRTHTWRAARFAASQLTARVSRRAVGSEV